MKRFLRMSYLVAALGGLGFFAMSVLLLGVWPGRVLERQIRADVARSIRSALTASEQRGRAVYAREGCAYCHTQQIRYLASDVARFGAATLAWETIFDYPQLWGTRRIGPDLSREALGAFRRLAALASLRAADLVADSVMPAFPWLFDGAPDRPSQEGSGSARVSRNIGARSRAGGPGRRGACARGLQLLGR